MEDKNIKKTIYNILYNTIFRDHNVANVKIKAITSRQFPYKIEVIAEKLYVPWAIDISDEGKLYFTERSGTIRTIEDGSIPKDNPIINSPVYSLGHRNPQGLAWNSKNVLYESEHGQLGHDEINIIQPGANYGWPLVQGDEDSTEITIQKPLIHSGEDTWAPSGIDFVNQGPWQGKLLVANLREVIQGKDGSIYLTTSNRDGRGNPGVSDDKIIRLIPK